MLNMFCHNDYSVSSEPYIIIYDDRFELITYGGLPQGFTEEEFFNAKSLPRNRELMKIMNNFGTKKDKKTLIFPMPYGQ